MRTRFAQRFLGTGLLCAASSVFAAAGIVKVDPAHVPSSSALRAAATTATRPSTASELFANPDRAYPPSCLQAPLATGLWQNDPNRVVTTVKLSGDLFAGAAEAAYVETDTLILFRVPCSNNASALMIELDRPSSLEGNTTTYPVVPLFGVYLSSTDIGALRIAQDPNTFLSNTIAGVPLYDSSVFVVENFYNSGLFVNFNPVVSIYFDNLLRDADEETLAITVPAYNPGSYASNAQPLPITGYQSGNFYDPTHSGEGIQIEVGDVNSPSPSHSIVVAWYTFDDAGVPYWLFGSAGTAIGATSATVTLYYGSDGGFAGNFGSRATFDPWGTVSVNFPDCNTMKFTYTANAGLPTGVPAGSGSKTWTRLTQLNGLTCQ